jgi:ABC-type multidrug transport system fused ATPase/permease subunit
LATDKRIRLLQEMILGSRVIKLYGWEQLFLKRLDELRLRELRLIRKQCLVSGLSVVLSVVVPAFSTIMAFLSYTWAGNSLVASIVAPVVFYFSLLDVPLGNIPLMVNAMIDSRESLRRIQAFLLSERLGAKIRVEPGAGDALAIKGGSFVWENGEMAQSCPATKKKPALKPKPQVQADSADAPTPTSATSHQAYPCRMLNVTPSTAYDLQEHAWVDPSTAVVPKDPESFSLKGINLQIPRGQLVAIVGPVGSGKSSLLLAILGEMKALTGEITIGGDIGYSPQRSWIMNGSVRDNILFGRELDEARYWAVVRQCAIEHDLAGLPHGDHTLIGDKGINLSGGQKARINLARAVYGQPQVALLDDPLSAVDAKVANVMFYKCICEGLLRGTTRLLVTHQLAIVPNADYVVVMRNGRIDEQGTYEELMAHGTSFAAMMTKFIGEDLAKESAYEEVIEEDETSDEEEGEETSGGEKAFDESTVSINYDQHADSARHHHHLHLHHGHPHGQHHGRKAKKGMYGFYFGLAGGWLTILLAFLVVGVNEFVRIGNDLWLMTVWAEDLLGLPTRSYQLVYASFGLGLVVMTWLSIVVFVMAGYVAAKRFHERAVTSLFRSPIAFFESTPIGRIVNRFSRDMEVIDAPLPDAVFYLMYIVGMLLSTILIILCSSYQAFLALLVALAMIFALQYLYTQLIRKLAKLYNGAVNPFMTHVSETYSGLSVIRVFNNEGIMLRRFHELADEVTKVGFVMAVLKRWTSVRAELTGALLVLIASILSLHLRISSSLAGLLISHILLAISFIDIFVKQYAEVEVNMVAVSRLSQYANDLEGEAMDETALPGLDPAWPRSGAIEFRDLTLAYKPHLPPVLHGISASIRHGERIAVIGRTGAGKSTILSAIFRMVEPASGTILVDGVDIRQLSLTQLRARLTIIPQEPVLFSGTLRFNLDPEGKLSDAAIWAALEAVNSRGFVAKLADKLDTAVQDFGENFSLGQRQLICLARAILRKSPVVLLDEPTASMDLETDEMVQEAIRRCFRDSTVISISHRLGGIEAYDRVMVMDSGRIVEFDEPAVLLADPASLLSQMVAEYSQF